MFGSCGPAADAADLRLLRRAQRLLRGARGDLVQVEVDQFFATQPGREQQLDDRAVAQRPVMACSSPAALRRRPLCCWKRGSRSSRFFRVRTYPGLNRPPFLSYVWRNLARGG
jgi:hypothetical protein